MSVTLSGATRGVDGRLLEMTQQAWSQILPGATINVTTGVSDHSPTNHAPGHAVDYQVIRPDGSVVRWNDPEAQAASRLFWEMGGHGVGAGPTYMGGTHMHWDISANGVRSWSDDDGGASDRGPGAAAWLNGVSAPGSTVPAGGNALAAAAPPQGSQNALATMGQPQEGQPEQPNQLAPDRFMLDPRMFMSRRQFTYNPIQV